MLLIALLNILIASLGIVRSFKNKNLLIIVWIILLYYALTSFIVCSPFYKSYSLIVQHSTSTPKIPIEITFKYQVIILICFSAFFLADYLFNRKQYTQLPLNIPKNCIIFLIVVFWTSLILVFGNFYGRSYKDFIVSGANESNWSLVLFQCSSCVLFHFAKTKNWLSLALSFIGVLIIISTTLVRSLIFYVLMPVVVYTIYTSLFQSSTIKQWLKLLYPIIFTFIILGCVMDIMRSGTIGIPETKLSIIALTTLKYCENYIVEPFGANSLMHYIWGFFSPIVNICGKMGLDISIDLPMSIPRFNAMISVDRSLFSSQVYHFPATIMLDLYLSWTQYLLFAGAFLFFSLVIFIFKIFQKNSYTIFLFSSIIIWHIYMLLRGSVDYSSTGISYSLLFLISFYILTYRTNYSEKVCA